MRDELVGGSKLLYIQGLRGLAILAVALGHAKVAGFAGGFIGVDIFFVLSGFLITELLARELSINGRINLIRFFARRLRRLFPALVSMVLVVSLVAVVFLTPGEQMQQLGAAMSSVLWASNLYFALGEKSYFGPGQEENLFLHTWSLGVEEQFYLLWPFFLLFAYGAWSRVGVSGRRARAIGVLVVTVIVGFLFSLLVTILKPDWAFYLPVTRIWQFALGGLVALWLIESPSATGSKAQSLSSVIGWIGGFTLIGGIIYLDSASPYPGWWALIPTLGTAAVLWASARSSTITRCLEIAPLRRLGDVSYSLYLWHWPILLIGWSVRPDGGVAYSLALLALGLVMALISYNLVENPLRYSNWWRAREKGTLAAALATMVMLMIGAATWKVQGEVWRRDANQLQYARYAMDIPKIYGMGCDEWYHSAEVRVCDFGGERSEKTVVLLGDSIAGQWFPVFESIFANEGWRLLVITKSACPMVDKPYFYPRIMRNYTECAVWRERTLHYLKDVKPELVVIASNRGYPFTEIEWKEAGGRLVRKISENAQNVVVLNPTPALGISGPDCLARNAWVPEIARRNCVASQSVDAQMKGVQEGLMQSVSLIPNAQTMDLNHLICPDGVCRALLGGQVVFRDDKHLSASFVQSLASEVREVFSRAGVENI